jgi:hypothetical protein
MKKVQDNWRAQTYPRLDVKSSPTQFPKGLEFPRLKLPAFLPIRTSNMLPRVHPPSFDGILSQLTIHCACVSNSLENLGPATLIQVSFLK